MLAVMAASLPSPWHYSVQLCPSRVRAMFVGCRMLLLMKSGWEVGVQAPSHHSNTRVRLEALWSHCPSAQLCAEQRQSPGCLQITPSWCCWAAVLAHSRNISGTRQALKKNMVSSDSSRKLSSCQTTNKLEAFPSLVLLDIRPEPSSFFSSSPKRFSMRPSICLIPSCTERPVLTLACWKSNDIWDSKAAKMWSCDGSEGKKHPPPVLQEAQAGFYIKLKTVAEAFDPSGRKKTVVLCVKHHKRPVAPAEPSHLASSRHGQDNGQLSATWYSHYPPGTG